MFRSSITRRRMKIDLFIWNLIKMGGDCPKTGNHQPVCQKRGVSIKHKKTEKYLAKCFSFLPNTFCQ
jgi:hypothetical protein